jgi:ubiquinone/menaquinone biosynthesis C-methylase UbiE
MQAIEAIEFKTRDAASYDALTEQFDHFTERLTSPLADRMVDLADLGPSDHALDVGTGTGVVALRAARIVRNGKVCGVDLSERMLSTARTRAEQLGFAEEVEFRQMDAEELQFADSTFDAVVSLFALLHFPDPLKALREIYRVIKPGGRLVVAVGSSPPVLSVAGMKHRLTALPDMLRRIQGRQLVAPGFLDSLVESNFPERVAPEEAHLASHSHNRTQGVESLVRSAGFDVLRTCWQGHQTELSTPEEFWEIQRTFSSIARKRLGNRLPGEIEEVRKQFVEKCRAVQSRGGDLVYPFAAFYVVAQRPEANF